MVLKIEGYLIKFILRCFVFFYNSIRYGMTHGFSSIVPTSDLFISYRSFVQCSGMCKAHKNCEAFEYTKATKKCVRIKAKKIVGARPDEAKTTIRIEDHQIAGD